VHKVHKVVRWFTCM